MPVGSATRLFSCIRDSLWWRLIGAVYLSTPNFRVIDIEQHRDSSPLATRSDYCLVVPRSGTLPIVSLSLVRRDVPQVLKLKRRSQVTIRPSM